MLSYFLKERSNGMVARSEWYPYNIPEAKDDHEVTFLQLYILYTVWFECWHPYASTRCVSAAIEQQSDGELACGTQRIVLSADA